jgi:hypothetical protein
MQRQLARPVRPVLVVPGAILYLLHLGFLCEVPLHREPRILFF